MNQNQLVQSPLKIDFGNAQLKLVTETPVMESDLLLKRSYEQDRIRGKRKNLPSYEEIASELRITSNGEIFFVKEKPGRSTKKAAGHKRKDGYIVVKLNGNIYLAHRIAWLLYTKAWPKEQLDHINGIRTDNRKNNLREVSPSENRLNVLQARNTSGIVGVTWAKKERNWRASIHANGKAINLGHFNNVEDAIAARRAAELKYGYLQRAPNVPPHIIP